MSFRKPPKGELPRYRFCWICSKKLQGNYFVYFMNEDGTEHITHQECAKNSDKDAVQDAEDIKSMLDYPDYDEDYDGPLSRLGKK